MKTGIIGLPQVGKSSLFRILTKVTFTPRTRGRHILASPKFPTSASTSSRDVQPEETTHASVEYVDLGAIGQEALKESAYLGHLRQVDAVAHVVRAFEETPFRIRGRSILFATLRMWSST